MNPLLVGRPPTGVDPMGMGPSATLPEGSHRMGDEISMQHVVLVGIAFVDARTSKNLFRTYERCMITVAEYPNRFGIRALVENVAEVQIVTFTTSEGYTHT